MNIMDSLQKIVDGFKEGIHDIFGIDTLKDLLDTVFTIKLLKISIVLAGVFSFIDQLTVTWLGMTSDVYFLFMMGIIVDVALTVYILLFIHNKKVEKSKLIGKTLLKIVVYSFLFGATYRFSLHFGSGNFGTFDVFRWLYTAVTAFCFLQLILGLMKKMAEAGFEEIKGLPKFIRDKIKQNAGGIEKEDKQKD